MSKNIHQVFIANPITSNASTDLMYFGQSPYAPGNDAAMTYANFSAQFVLSTLATHNSVLTTNSSGVITPIVVTDGQVVIGSTIGAPLAATLTAGSGISITNGHNSISIAASTGAGSPLTTKGDLYTFSTVNTRLAVGTTDGQILQVSSGAATGLAWSTPTYPTASGSAGKILRSDGTNNLYSTATFADTYAVSTILYASGSNAVSGLATANSAVLVTNSSGVPAWSGTMTNGQVIIGSTSGTPTASTLTAGTGISVTNGAASITIANTTNALTWNDVSGTTQTAIANNGYIISNASQTTVTIPATIAEGSVIAIAGKGAAGWILQANTGQTIHLGSSASSSAGSLTSTNQWDCVQIVCVTANTTFTVTSVMGNLTVA